MKYRLAYLSLGEIASYSSNAEEQQIPKALARDFEMTLLSPSGFALPPDLKEMVSVEAIMCRSGGEGTLWGKIQYLLGVLHVLNKRRFDCFCSSHGTSNFIVGYIMSLFVSGKWIVFLWDSPTYIVCTRKVIIEKCLVKCTHLLYQLCANRCSRLIQFIHPNMLRSMGVAEAVIEQKIFSLPGGVEGKYLEEIGGRSSPDACRVGVVSVASSVKGFEYVIKAFVKAASLDLRLKLSWIGECAEASKAYAAECARTSDVYPERITFTGPLEYGAAMKAAAECGICVFAYQDIPKFRWNYVLKIGEYMALGRCTVAVDLLGVREYVRHDETGILVKPGDISELADTLVKLAADPEKQARLGSTAQAFIRGYRWEDITRRMTADICSVLSSNRTCR